MAALRDHGAGIRWEPRHRRDVLGRRAVLPRRVARADPRVHAQLLREAIDRGDVVAQQGLRTGRAILVWLVRDRADEARAQLAAAEASLAPGFQLPNVLALQAAANLELYAGDAGRRGAAPRRRVAAARSGGRAAPAAPARRAGLAARADRARRWHAGGDRARQARADRGRRADQGGRGVGRGARLPRRAPAAAALAGRPSCGARRARRRRRAARRVRHDRVAARRRAAPRQLEGG